MGAYAPVPEMRARCANRRYRSKGNNDWRYDVPEMRDFWADQRCNHPNQAMTDVRMLRSSGSGRDICSSIVRLLTRRIKLR